MTPKAYFKKAILSCQEKHQSAVTLEARTHDALYEAIAAVKRLYSQMQAHKSLDGAFHDELKSRNMRRANNELLTLVKLAMFPDVLSPKKKHDRQNRKLDLNKASSYAKVISYAHAKKVKSADLPKFIRDNGGIQAIAKAESQRDPRPAKRPDVNSAKPVSATAAGPKSIAVKPPKPGYRLVPLQLWCTDKMAAKVLQVMSDAHSKGSIEFFIRGRLGTGSGIVAAFWVPRPLPPLPNLPLPLRRRRPLDKGGPMKSPSPASAEKDTQSRTSQSKSVPGRLQKKSPASIGKESRPQ